jgi:predicted NAD-dependent protein-ADP-ribosyltransferase YbiA (DUF1768 family)
LGRDKGTEDDVSGEPINITFGIADPRLRPISNLAHTRFTLDGRAYASIEGFWQGLKYPAEADRRRIAALHGKAAKRAGGGAPRSETILYEGAEIAIGSPAHWALMERACLAKFTQNHTARAALLATGTRLITHVTNPDSRTIPGVVMAEIWTRIRDQLRPSPASPSSPRSRIRP